VNEDEKLIQIGAFSDSFQANFAKEILLSNNIHCRVVGDAFQMIELYPTLKISIQIHQKDLLMAKELLSIYFEDLS